MSHQTGSYDINKAEEASSRKEGPNNLKVQPSNQNANESNQQNETSAAFWPNETFPEPFPREKTKGKQFLCGQREEETQENDEEQQLLPPESQQQITRVNFKENAGGNSGQTFTNTSPLDPNTHTHIHSCSTISTLKKDDHNANDDDDDDEDYGNGYGDGDDDDSVFYNNTSKEARQQTYVEMENSAENGNHHRRCNSSGGEPNEFGIVLTPNSLNATQKTVTTSLPTTISPGIPGSSAHNANPNPNSNENVYKGPKCWVFITKNWTMISEQLALLAVFLALWAVAYILLPKYAEPSSGIMRIGFLFVGAQMMGIFVTLVHLPDMLGMLFFGVLYTNVGLADFTGYQPLEAFLREMALINIMLLAGLGLDASAFKKLWAMILRLTLVPTLAEVAVIAFLAKMTLQMSWMFGILLGLVVTAVSPNVVVTVMLKLKEERLGLNNGIHTLIYAMTTCNDVVAIFLFGVILGVIYSTGTLTEQILQGPIGIGIGVVFGSLYGLMLRYLPSGNANYTNGVRFVLIILGGTISVIGSKAIKYPSAGALGCVAIAFVAGLGWKKQEAKMTARQRRENLQSSVPKRLDLLWKFLKPVSFALIGKEINFGVLEGRVVGYGVLLVLVGSLFRLAFAYISTYGGNLTRKERAYITISGFPKATVQASIGPIALDLARQLNDELTMPYARNVLIISVLAIIFTAPLGAILMLRLAPVWLKRSSCHNGTSTTEPDTVRVVSSNKNV